MSSDLAADIVRAAKKADDRGGGHVAIAVAVLRILDNEIGAGDIDDIWPTWGDLTFIADEIEGNTDHD